MTITEANEVIGKLFEAEKRSQEFVARSAIEAVDAKFGKTCTPDSIAALMAKTQRLSFTHGALSVLHNLGLIDDPCPEAASR